MRGVERGPLARRRRRWPAVVARASSDQNGAVHLVVPLGLELQGGFIHDMVPNSPAVLELHMPCRPCSVG
jgi:hypothetical protein